jgi:hypothetical protein
MSRRNYINRKRHVKSLQLEGTIVESILNSCMLEASLVELTRVTTSELPTLYNMLKKYLFYLIEYNLISYSGQKKLFAIRVWMGLVIYD